MSKNIILIKNSDTDYQRLCNELFKALTFIKYDVFVIECHSRLDLLDFDLLKDNEFVICFEDSILNLPHKHFNTNNIRVVHIKNTDTVYSNEKRFMRLSTIPIEELYGVFIGGLDNKRIQHDPSIVQPILGYDKSNSDVYLRPLVNRLNFLGVPSISNSTDFNVLNNKVFVNLTNKKDMRSVLANLSGCKEISCKDKTIHSLIKEVEGQILEKIDIEATIDSIKTVSSKYNILSKLPKIFKSFNINFDYETNFNNTKSQNESYVLFINNLLRSYAQS